MCRLQLVVFRRSLGHRCIELLNLSLGRCLILRGCLLFGGNSVGLYLPYRFSERLAHGIHHLTFLNLDVDAVSDKLRHPGINHLQQSLDSLVGYIRAVGRSGCRQWLLNRRFLWCGGVSGAGQFIVGSDLVFAIIHFFFNEIVGIYSEGPFDAAKKSHLSSFSIIFGFKTIPVPVRPLIPTVSGWSK